MIQTATSTCSKEHVKQNLQKEHWMPCYIVVQLK